MADFSRSLAAGGYLIGMVHVRALPGSPRHSLPVARIVETAVAEAALYRACGVDAVLIENMHDTPYVRRVGPEITATMAVVAQAVRAVGLPCGIQVLAGANREALAVAQAAGLEFVRVEGFVFAHVADEGLIESCAGDLLRYRRQLGAEGVLIVADIKKKHSAHALTADVDIAETARAAEFFGADGVVVTGRCTGEGVALDDLRAVRRVCSRPVLVGSGVTAEALPDLLPLADAFIVGSSLKLEGRWDRPLCRERIEALVAARDRA